MIYDENITKSDAINSFKRKWWIYLICVVSAVLLNCFVYYLFTKPKMSEQFYVWVSAPVNLEKALINDIKSTAKENGKKVVHVENYAPNSNNYFRLFGTKGGVTTNIFVFNKSEIELHDAKDFYLNLENSPFVDLEDNYIINGVPYGVHLAGDYYMLINWHNYSYDTCYAVIQTMLDYVEENGYEIG